MNFDGAADATQAHEQQQQQGAWRRRARTCSILYNFIVESRFANKVVQAVLHGQERKLAER